MSSRKVGASVASCFSAPTHLPKPFPSTILFHSAPSPLPFGILTVSVLSEAVWLFSTFFFVGPQLRFVLFVILGLSLHGK